MQVYVDRGLQEGKLWHVYDISYTVRSGQPVLLLFVKDTEGNRDTFIVRGFKPFFWAPKDEAGTGEEAIDIFGRRVVKVYAKLPSDVRALRKRYSWTDEADIRFPLVFLIFYGIRTTIIQKEDRINMSNQDIPVKLTRLFFDIEVANPPEIFADPQKAEYPIVTVSMCYEGKNLVIQVDPKGTRKSTNNVIYVRSEKELLKLMCNTISALDPDILAGYNTGRFDWPYIFARARKLGISLKKLSPIGTVYIRPDRERKWKVGIQGRVVLDYYELYKKWKIPSGQPDSFDLKAVVVRELGSEEAYEDLGRYVGQLFHEDRIEDIVSYGLKDAYVLWKMDEKLGIIEYFDHIRRLVGCLWEDVLSNSRIVDVLFLRMSDKPLPTKSYDENQESYQGAVVFEPQRGLHRNVAVYDLKSMYPSIILAKNISPEMKLRMDDGRVVFRSSPEGLAPKVTRYLMQIKEEVSQQMEKYPPSHPMKELLYKKKMSAKFLVNSIYGVLGFRAFRLYDKDCAEEITRSGREIIRSIARFVGEDRVVYGDTDSVFVLTSSLEEAKRLEGKIRNFLKELSSSWRYTLTIKFEKFFRTLLVGAKKRYAGHLVYEDGKETDMIKVAGYEPKRSDTSLFTRDLFHRFLEALLRQGDIAKALEILREAWKKIEDEPLSRVGLPKGLNKETYKVANPWVEGKRFMEERYGYHIPGDVKPKLVYARGLPVKGFCIWDGEDPPREVMKYVDWDAMREKNIRKKFERILNVLGLTFDAIFGQKTLEDWM